MAQTYDFVEDVKLNKAEFKLMIETIPGESGWVVTYFSKAFAKWGKQANPIPQVNRKQEVECPGLMVPKDFFQKCFMKGYLRTLPKKQRIWCMIHENNVTPPLPPRRLSGPALPARMPALRVMRAAAVSKHHAGSEAAVASPRVSADPVPLASCPP